VIVIVIVIEVGSDMISDVRSSLVIHCALLSQVQYQSSGGKGDAAPERIFDDFHLFMIYFPNKVYIVFLLTKAGLIFITRLNFFGQ
jgi:hypothetical protein